MRVFFLAETVCALSVGGVHLGLVDGFERSVEISPSDGIFCELKPLGDYLPVRFCLDESFLFSPPGQIRLYYAEDAVAVYACGFLRADQSLRVLAQTRLSGSRLTFVRQGKLQLHLENENGFFLVELPDALEGCSAEPCGKNYLLRGKTAFLLLGRKGETILFSEGSVLSAGETIRAEVPFRDSLGHTAVCEWREGELVSCAVRSLREPTEATFALALFESALVGADCAPYLAPSLAEKASSLKSYLGDFVSVVLTGERDRVGLVYPRKENVFDVRYFKIETEGGKVKNVFPAE